MNYFIKKHLSYLFITFLLISISFSKEYVLLVSFDGFRYDYSDEVSTPNFDILEKVVKKCFSQRRKKIKNTLEEITNHIELNEFFENRPEMLSSDEFIKISNIVEFNE